jgi:hypothetical protein
LVDKDINLISTVKFNHKGNIEEENNGLPSSLKKIATDQLGNRAVVRGMGGVTPLASSLITAGFWTDI